MLIAASTLAGLRGALILFVALLSWRCGLADSPGSSLPEWGCVGLSASSAVLIGVASVSNDAAGAAGLGSLSPALCTLVGTLLAVLAYLLAAAQMVVEQTWLDRSLSKWTLMGWQGVWGLLLCAVLLLALQLLEDAGALPDVGVLPLDRPAAVWQCLASTPAVPALAVAYMASSFVFNTCLLELAKVAGSNFRVVVFTARGALTWAVQLILFYAAQSLELAGSAVTVGSAYGVPLTPMSALEAAGFVLLLGSVVWRARLRAAHRV